MDYDDESPVHLGNSVAHPLLRKNLLARVKVNSTKAIKGNETFGKPTHPKDHGVKGSLQWQVFPGTSPSSYERNFRALNKESAQLGVTTARGTYEYRKDHDFRLTPKTKTFVSHNPGVYDRNFTYGMQTDPDHTMKKLIRHGFGEQWLDTHAAIDERKRERARSLSPMSTNGRPVVVTNASHTQRGGLGTATKNAIQESEVALEEKDHKQAAASFRMRQFMDAPKRVDDRWDREPNRLQREYNQWNYPDYYTQREKRRSGVVDDGAHSDGEQY